MSYLVIAAVFLGAAIIAVPLSKRLGLGSVLGYLAAGVVIGPSALGLVTNVDDILHFAELGVVLLLFVIGLELQPSRLMTMRKAVFGLGGVQVLATALVLALAGLAFGLAPQQAVVVGLALSLSSTAFALQILAEKRELATAHGRASFAILLFQDLAVIPILALLPLLAPATGIEGGDPVWLAVAKALAVIAAVVVGGRYLLRYVLKAVAWSGVHEVFTAMALFTVIGVALLMDMVGLSMALGAFLAGVLLAESEYRHELEADIEPFKGLLLGLFFMAVGMSVNLGLVVEQPGLIVLLVVGLMAVKSVVLVGLGLAMKKPVATSFKLAVTLSQGGEFAFVIFGVAVGARLLETSIAEILILVVTVSMGVTPLLFLVSERLTARRDAAKPKDYDTAIPVEGAVIIAGFGRFGQVVARTLRARRINFTALDISSAQVDFVKRYGNKIYYGDASRLDLLRAAGAGEAKVFVLAVDDVEASLRTAETVRRHFPELAIYARARNRQHVYELMDLGVEHIVRDTFYSSLEMAQMTLRGLGFADAEARRTVETFRDHDIKRLYAHRDIHNDEEKMMRAARDWAQELEELFAQDEAEGRQAAD
jgi:glutathione-regulated potassium-efflux system protein KefB